jgi:predicted permease
MQSGLRRLVSRIAAPFTRRRDERDFDGEIEEHLALLEERFRRQGMAPEQARYAARRQFGGIAQLKERRRESRGFAALEIFVQDAFQAIRALSQRPAFTATAVATIALGIGANVAVFSVIDAVVLRPLNAPDANRVVRFGSRYGEGFSDIANFPQFNLWRRQTDLFEYVSAHRLDPVNLTGENPEQIHIARVSASFFPLFGARVALGRAFTDTEDGPGGDRVIVLSDAFWRRRVGGNARALGTTITLGSDPYRVIGVVAAGFDSEQFNPPPDAYVPFQIDPASSDNGSYEWVTARLGPGVTVAMANAQLPAVAEEYRRRYALGSNVIFEVEPLQETLTYNTRRFAPLWLGAVSFVLLIACANMANLMLARAAGRKREIAIRAATGASRGRLVRQLLTECIALALAGGAVGLALGFAGIRALVAMYSGGTALNIPRLGQAGSAVTLDWRLAGFAIVISSIAGILSGILPALQGSSVDLSRASKGQPPGRNKSRWLLVVTQIGLASVLLSAAALMIRGYVGLRLIDPGFDSSHVETLEVSASATPFEKTAPLSQLVREGAERIRALPGVESAAAACCIPLETVWQLPFIVEGRPLNGRFHAFAGWTFVSPDYFKTFKIPLLRGRGFTERDDAGAPGVVIINETMARRFWPGADPLHDHLIVGRGMRPEYDRDPLRQIVGIVGDIRDQFLNVRPRPAMYVPIAQLPDGINTVNLRLLPMAWFVRWRDPSPPLKAAQRELQEASGGLPVARSRAMDQIKVRSLASVEFQTLLVSAFGAAALLLAAVGVYGVVAHSVEQRSKELGIRLALGAEPGAIRNRVMLEALWMALTGIALGFAGDAGLYRLHLTQFGPADWNPVLLAAPAVLGSAALLAAWIPALHATCVDPVTALRCE